MHQCARLLGETLEELAASCAIRPDQLSLYKTNEWFPANVALLFHMREQHWYVERGIKN